MPRVSIGLPVYNGENYLAAAIASLQSQTFQDIEIIICDNASTDGTEAICTAVAGEDDRIRYVRNAQNVGAAANYNLACELATGEYFKWAAHDDLCEPTFVEACVAALEADSGAVLAFPRVAVIDAAGELLREVGNMLDTGNPDPAARFAELLGQHVVTEIFGVIRSAALEDTKLIAPYPSADRMLLAHLALKGRFCYLDEPLFVHRDHDERSHKKLRTAQDRAAWFAPRTSQRRPWPAWRFVRELVQIVARTPQSVRTRLICMRHIVRWMRDNQDRLMGDLGFGTSK